VNAAIHEFDAEKDPGKKTLAEGRYVTLVACVNVRVCSRARTRHP
jgi:hypothetical protein